MDYRALAVFLPTRMFMLKNKDITALATFTLPDSLFAAPWWYHPVLTLTGGASSAEVGQSQTLTMAGDFTLYNYARTNSNSWRALFGGFVGTEFPITSTLDLQTGIAYYQPGNGYKGKGILTQGVDAPSADIFNYSYSVATRQLLLEGKLLWHVREKFRPYISLGLGAAFNSAYAYTVDTPPFLTFTPQFSSNNNTNFSYSVGAGVDYAIKQNWRIGAAYRFASYGKANLGRGPLDTIQFIPVLKQSNLYSQEVIGQLTYLIS
jgi:opacity protein-like surface antigen